MIAADYKYVNSCRGINATEQQSGRSNSRQKQSLATNRGYQFRAIHHVRKTFTRISSLIQSVRRLSSFRGRRETLRDRALLSPPDLPHAKAGDGEQKRQEA